jgi:hypothetical protein
MRRHVRGYDERNVDGSMGETIADTRVSTER